MKAQHHAGEAEPHPHRLIFASVCGSRLYGFHRPGSDFDVRGAHVLPLELVIGLDKGPGVIQRSRAATPGALKPIS